MLFDFSYVLRRLTRAPGFVAIVVLSLGVGMSAVVAMLGVLDAVFLRPPTGVRDPSRVVGIGSWARSERATYPDYTDLWDNATTLESVGAFAIWDYSVRIGTEVVPARGMLATYTLLPLLGTAPVLGRWFSAEEDRPGGDPVVVVSLAFWRGRLGGESQNLGAVVRLGGRSFTVIGVLPDGFTAPDLSPVDLVLPITNAPWFGGHEALRSRDYRWLRIVGRLRPGVTTAAASAEATLIYRRANKEVRGVDQAALSRMVLPVRPIVVARQDPSAPTTKVSLWATVLAVTVLLTALGNVASLFLARGIRERHGLAIHAVMGGSRRRLCGRVLLEVAVLVSASGALCLALARGSGRLLTSVLLANSVPPPSIDRRMVAMVLGLSVLTAATCAVWPVIRASRVNLRNELAGGLRTIARSHRLAFRVLLIAQSGLCFVLVSEAVLFGASLRNATRVDLGIDLKHLLVADVDLHAAGLSGPDAVAAARRALDRSSAVRDVVTVGMTNAAALPGFLSYPLLVQGRDSLPTLANSGPPLLNAVTPSYLEAVGVRLLGGRAFSSADFEAARPVALVSARLAQLYWPSQSPLGQCIKVGSTANPCAVVIGVVSDRRAGPLDARRAAEVYLPLGSPLIPQALANVFPGREVAVRVAGDPSRLAPTLSAALLAAVPELTSVRVRTGHEYLERQFRGWRLGAGLLSAFATVALALAAVGVFGASSYVVAQSTGELGVRAAVGARPRDLATLVLGESARVAAAGVAIGIGAAVAVARFVSAFAFGVSPLDARIYGLVAGVLIATTLLAAALPAVRAAATDPIGALRSE